LLSLLTQQRISLLLSEQDNYPVKAYLATDMLNDLQKGIFSELTAHKPISSYRRDLQKTYVDGLITLLNPKAADTETDELSIVKAQAKGLEKTLKRGALTTSNPLNRAHLTDLYERLDLALHPKF
jgi:hypothetical protein